MGDVMYGVCCIDDYIVCVMGCDFLVYYVYFCFILVDVIKIKIFYVFVDIFIDMIYFFVLLECNFFFGKIIVLVGII